jgi:hypothetical protein
MFTLPMLLPMMDSAPQPCKKGAKAHPADGRPYAERGGFEGIEAKHRLDPITPPRAGGLGCKTGTAPDRQPGKFRHHDGSASHEFGLT